VTVPTVYYFYVMPRIPQKGHRETFCPPAEMLFWEKVDIRDDNECWPWMGCRYWNVYGQLTAHCKRIKAHRCAFELTFGPTDKWVLHKCDNPPCCNPAHLFEGDAMSNVADMISKGRAVNWHVMHTACRRYGHALTPENTRVFKNGRYRACRACARLSAKRWRARHPKRRHA
jgi:hypothetical protein